MSASFFMPSTKKKRDGTASAFSRLRSRRASGLSSSVSQTNLHPMCIDLHQQNAAHPKHRLGHLERNSPSPSSQMQFRWVGWPTPPSRVAIFACDVIADITHYFGRGVRCPYPLYFVPLFACTQNIAFYARTQNIAFYARTYAYTG